MIRVLFVCLGNICRSPMAEAVFQHKVTQAGLADRIESDSAGTGDWHLGAPPHHGTRAILEANAISHVHRARQITALDLEAFDYVVTMDEANRRDVGRVGAGRARVVPLLDYAPHTGVTEVPDPYFTGNFQEVYDLVGAATDGLLEAIRREHGL